MLLNQLVTINEEALVANAVSFEPGFLTRG